MFLAKRAPIEPLYSTLGDVDVILDARGLRDNTTNTYGQVTSGVVQVWNSLVSAFTWSALPVGSAGEASVLKFQDGYVEFPGYVVLFNNQASSLWNEYSYASPATNIKYTIHAVLKVGQDDHPNWMYGFWGTNGLSGANRGTATDYDDRVLVPNSDGIVTNLTAGGGVTILVGSPDDIVVPNVPFVYTEETDISQAAGDRRKFYINGTLFAYTITSTSTSVVTGPTYTMYIGSVGNKVFPFRGWISHIIMQTRIESSGVRTAFINSLLPFKNKRTNYFFNVDESKTYSVYHTLSTAGRYYFGQGLIQNPLTPNTILKIFHDGNVHVYDADKKVAAQKSTDRGRTWGTQFDVYDPDTTGPYAIQDGEWGYDSSGTVHGIVDSHTAIATAGGTHKLIYITSTDDLTSTTVTDITSQVPADGLVMIRAHGNIIENNGFLYACLYKQTEEDDNTNVAIYIMRKPLGAGTTWTFFLVDSAASATTYLNEQSIVALDDSTILMLVRNETTEEYSQYTGTSNGSSWTARADVSFGETFSFGSPPLLSGFNVRVKGVVTRVIAFWIQDRSNGILKVVYATAAELIASGTVAWDLDTKFTVIDDTQAIMYGNVCHMDNTFNAIASFARDPGTLTENTFVTFHCPATNYYNTIDELGLL
jgi:hypothetical protein